MKNISLSGKKKKMLIGGIVVFLLLILVCTSALRSRAEKEESNKNTAETVHLEKRTLVSSVSATGKVTSLKQKDITANINNLEFQTIYVEVGDYVKEGDLLCEFDVSEIEEDMAEAQSSLHNSLARADIDLAGAKRRLNETVQENEIQNERNEEAVYDALQDYNEQLEKTEDLKGESSKLQDSINSKNKEIEDKNKEIENKKSEIADKENQLKKAEKNNSASQNGNNSNDKEINKIKATLENLNAQLEDLQNQLFTLQAEKYQLDNQWMSKETEISQAKLQEDSLLSAYEKSEEFRQDSIRSGKSSVLTQEASLETAKLSNEMTGLSDKKQIENYEKQLEERKLTSPMDGVITKVNFEKGDLYNGSIIMTIEDDSSYEIEAHIDEYDIGKIKEGQEVVVKTNATGEEELTGTVTRISPRADAALLQGGEVSYLVTVSLDKKHEMIRMDMTARLSIILDKKEAVWAIPYDALMEDENGLFYIRVEEVQETKEESNLEEKDKALSDQEEAVRNIYVTKGLESDYYVEILSEELEEGMTVLLPPNEDSLMDLRLRMVEQGAMGGF